MLNSKNRNYLIVYFWKGVNEFFLLAWQNLYFSIWASASKCSYFSCNFCHSSHLKIIVCAVFIMFFVKTLQCKCFFSLRKIRSECRDYGALVAFSIYCWDMVYCIDINRVCLFTLNRVVCKVYFSKVFTICCKHCDFTACFTINVYIMLLCRWAGTVSSSLLKIISVIKLSYESVLLTMNRHCLLFYRPFMSITVYISSEVMALCGSTL